MRNLEITKELIIFLSVLVAITTALALDKISPALFKDILLLIIGGTVGWSAGFLRGRSIQTL